MDKETVHAYIERTGKTQAQVAREMKRSPQALNNMLGRHTMHVVCDPADTILYVGYYDEYYRRDE